MLPFDFSDLRSPLRGKQKWGLGRHVWIIAHAVLTYGYKQILTDCARLYVLSRDVR